MHEGEIKKKRAQVWEEYLETVRNDAQRKKEVEEQQMAFGEVVMKYGIQIIGEPDENGYPLYIAFHGGGQGDTPDVNNQQWEIMGIYYARAVKQGIYINPRGVRDTWDTHANPESFPLYDRLIQNMIAFYGADPNRVYICGFSAGGDGVYLVGPPMADRFAAVSMSAGHHNYNSVLNLYNTPIRLQVGMNDFAYSRNTVTVEYMNLLSQLSEVYGGGYVHDGYVHKDKGHNFRDWSDEEQEVLADPNKWIQDGCMDSKMANTNVIDFLKQYTRNPLPSKVVWDLDKRPEERDVESFYWVRVPKKAAKGMPTQNPDVKVPRTESQRMIVAHVEKEYNRIVVEKNTTGKSFEVLLNEEMLDVTKPIEVVGVDGTTKVVEPEISLELLKETTYERGDYNYQFVGCVSC